ncbi:uncharacterized protein V1518DRAFT_410112 [Limtongia smithiae]|uniref:uncharacterized protein n=1 Tax=Limtongia smithiae TaxID=1125753 RepID=UPI0034CEA8F1
MVGLAGPRKRTKMAVDPRNTAWSNDTERFGHRHLEKMGWKPGTGLGLSAASSSITAHVRVAMKDDFEGLGAAAARAAAAKRGGGEFAPGLDSFEALLNRLNTAPATEAPKEPQEKAEKSMWEQETEIAREYTRMGKWGARVKFVFGECLGPTIEEAVEIVVQEVEREIQAEADAAIEAEAKDKKNKKRRKRKQQVDEDEDKDKAEDEAKRLKRDKKKEKKRKQEEKSLAIENESNQDEDNIAEIAAEKYKRHKSKSKDVKTSRKEKRSKE